METAGAAAPSLAVAALLEPTPVLDAVALAAGIAGAVSNFGCSWDPQGPRGWPAGFEPKGCWKSSGNCIYLAEGPGNNVRFGPMSEFISLTDTGVSGPNGGTEWECTFKVISGEIKKETGIFGPNEVSRYQLILSPEPGCSCIEHRDSPAEPKPDPVTYEDEESGCTLNVQMLGWAERSPGVIEPVFDITPVLPEGRSDTYGRIGGCNFQPVIYAGGPGGPGGPTIPPIYPPGGEGDDWWKDAIAGAIRGAAAWAVQELLKSLTQPRLDPAAFTFVAPCDYLDPATKEEKDYRVYEWPDQDVYSRIVSNQAVLMEMLQQHLNWKTPTCNGTSTKGRYARSITFQSDENTDRGNRRCTKRLGYRSNTACELESLYAHWRNFSWETGPVIVGHSGSALGSPQVWAASVDEGKRVIQHAGREAGIDPNQIGEWSTGSSDSPRYGVSHTVKLMEVRGLWQATAREGPDGYAQAVWTMPDP